MQTLAELSPSALGVTSVEQVFCRVVCGVHKGVHPWLLDGQYIKVHYFWIA